MTPSWPSEVEPAVHAHEKIVTSGNRVSTSSPNEAIEFPFPRHMFPSSETDSSVIDSSIVGRKAGFEIPPQRSFDLSSRRKSTGSTREFGEQLSHPPADTSFPASTISLSTTIASATANSSYGNNHINSRSDSNPRNSPRGITKSCQGTSVTTTRVNARTQWKHEEQELTGSQIARSQDTTTIASATATDISFRHTLDNTRNTPRSKSTIQSHRSATAAEIALGLPSSYNLQDRNLNHQQMGTAARPGYQHWTSVQSRHTEQHIVENLHALKEGDEQTTRRTENGMAASPGRLTPMHDSSEYAAPRNVIGTPSTMSTEPSTDDASLMTDYKLDDTVLPHLLQPGHRRNLSGGSFGEECLLPGGLPLPRSTHVEMGNPWRQPSHGQRTIGGLHRIHNGQQQRVASFRNQRLNTAPTGWHQPVNQPFTSDAHYQQQNRRRPLEIEVRQPHVYGQQGFVPYHQQPQVRMGNSPTRQAGGQRSMTPPRNFRGQRQQGLGSAGPKSTPTSPNHQNLNPQRSSAEVLKTLLRKKACLFEPDTSRAVALITWLVGKELAMEFGFFSRQQLQSGVHACVASKIEGGIITRTRVNRCMQIILNSCFHYIIPRADGTEEKGDYFRKGFASSVKDDAFMLRYLSRLWNDVTVDREIVLKAALNDAEEKPHKEHASTPKSSPKLSSAEAPKSPRDFDHDHIESKRAVLLSFNENVRSAEDVFRCHNEFIRDTANAAHLQLTASEWRSFFGREAGHGNYLLGKIGIPMTPQDSAAGQDVFGRMAPEEAGKFRTSWCCKRYDHDHSLCGFGHVEINGGWLRRNPFVYPCKNEMCPYVTRITDSKLGTFYLNECPHGLQCDNVHTMEEMMYHPNNYKCKVCPSSDSQSSCPMGDICAAFHPQESTRPSKKVLEKHAAPRHVKKGEQPANFKAAHLPPKPAPVVHASPAPFSSFEHQLLMPGLQNLYRRNCAVIRAHLRSKESPSCSYSCFGDDDGISAGAKENSPSQIMLPSVRRAEAF